MNFELNSFLYNHPEIKYDNSYEVIIINGIAYIPCEVKTTSSYYIVQEDGAVTYKFYDTLAADKYISPYNRGIIGRLDREHEYSYTNCGIDEADYLQIGYGNAVVIVDIETNTIIRAYYFKDTYNMPSPIRFFQYTDEYLLFDYAEHSYIIYTTTHEVCVFESGNVQGMEQYVLLLPYSGYDLLFSQYKLFNTRTKALIDITQLINTIIDCWGVKEDDIRFSCAGIIKNNFSLLVSANELSTQINIEDLTNETSTNLASKDTVQEVRKQLNNVQEIEKAILRRQNL